jgi:3' exoribonuclease, RNase T-like
MSRIWFDTEFIEDGTTIDLISIGMVREDGATYYAETDQWIPGKASQWVKDNVIVYLEGGYRIKPRDVIAREIVEFAGDKPEFWGYYADYDWVVLCQLYGTMVDLPKGWPMFCLDIKQACVSIGDPKLPKQGKGEHHALADARWNRLAWEFVHDQRKGAIT